MHSSFHGFPYVPGSYKTGLLSCTLSPVRCLAQSAAHSALQNSSLLLSVRIPVIGEKPLLVGKSQSVLQTVRPKLDAELVVNLGDRIATGDEREIGAHRRH